MSIINLGIFRKPLSAEKYKAIAPQIALQLEVARQQLNLEHPGQRSPELTAAFLQLQAIEDALKYGPSARPHGGFSAFSALRVDALEDPLLTELSGIQQVNQPALTPQLQVKQDAAAVHKQAKQTALYLEQQLQNVVNVYNKLVTAPEFTNKGNQKALAKIQDTFLDFFTKIADLFRKLFGSKLQANWTHTPAQSNLDKHFTGVFMCVEDAKTAMSSKQDHPRFQPQRYQGI